MGAWPKFARVRTASVELNRVQDSIAAVLDGVARAVQATPAFGAFPGWVVPSLSPPWANLGGAFASAGFLRDMAGVVHVKGVLLNGSGAGSSAPIFTLPAGYRPSATLRFAVEGAGATAQFLSVTSLGVVTPEVAVAAGASCDLTFSFFAEQ